jgi:hypothetical protein
LSCSPELLRPSASPVANRQPLQTPTTGRRIDSLANKTVVDVDDIDDIDIIDVDATAEAESNVVSSVGINVGDSTNTAAADVRVASANTALSRIQSNRLPARRTQSAGSYPTNLKTPSAARLRLSPSQEAVGRNATALGVMSKGSAVRSAKKSTPVESTVGHCIQRGKKRNHTAVSDTAPSPTARKRVHGDDITYMSDDDETFTPARRTPTQRALQ